MRDNIIWCEVCGRYTSVPEIHEDCEKKERPAVSDEVLRFKNPDYLHLKNGAYHQEGRGGRTLIVAGHGEGGNGDMQRFDVEDYDLELVLTPKFKPGYFFRVLGPDFSNRNLYWLDKRPAMPGTWKRATVTVKED